MKKPGRILLSAILAAAVTVGCNDKNTKEDNMKQPNNKQDNIFNNEPVCIYGPPEMLGALNRIDDSPEIDLPEPEEIEEPTTDKTNNEE